MCCTTTTNKKCTQNDKYECLDSLGGLIVANFDTSFQFIFLVWDGRGYEGLSEPVGGNCVLKWGFMRTFPGNQDATLKKMSEHTFIRFC